jgi:hypothetical protein
MNESKAPNPFECAKRVVGVNVVLKPDDIVRASPKVSIADAEELLNRYGARIAAEMLNTGIRTALNIIKEGSAP